MVRTCESGGTSVAARPGWPEEAGRAARATLGERGTAAARRVAAGAPWPSLLLKDLAIPLELSCRWVS